jgi:hypothetical protein
MPGRRVLLTGATGYIASQMLPTLRERYDLVLCDVRATDRQGAAVEGVRIADLADPDLSKNRHLFEGVDTVVHLAYNHRSRDPERDYFDERVNVDMAYNVYKLTQQAGGRRVVMASSNHAADFYEYLIWERRLDRIGPDAPRPLSDNYYGWAKEAYEHLGFVFATGGGGAPRLEVVQVRIGAPRPIEAGAVLQRRAGRPGRLHARPGRLHLAARPDAAVRQVGRRPGRPRRVGRAVPGLLRHLRQHAHVLEHRQRAQGHRLRARGRLGARVPGRHRRAP